MAGDQAYVRADAASAEIALIGTHCLGVRGHHHGVLRQKQREGEEQPI